LTSELNLIFFFSIFSLIPSITLKTNCSCFRLWSSLSSWCLVKPVLKYSFLTSVPFLILYNFLILIGGYPVRIPNITDNIDIYLILFYLLVTYAIFLIMLLVLHLIKPARRWLQRGNTYFKLVLLHIISFVGAIWFPTYIFVIIYFIPFTTWAGLSAILA